LFGIPKCLRKKKKKSESFKSIERLVKKNINIFTTRLDKKVPLAVLVLRDVGRIFPLKIKF